VTTDTHGAPLADFVPFDLVGPQLSPRIRGLGKATHTRQARHPAAGSLLTRRRPPS
jgi:hypothetical protein